MSPLRIRLPHRPGPRPATDRPTPERPGPHGQTSQNALPLLQDELMRRMSSLPGVRVGPSRVSVPGARALHLDVALALGPREAFQRGREYAHLHAVHDGSLHRTLDPVLYQQGLASGWGEPHPISGTMMVWRPRNEEELEMIWSLVIASYEYAVGSSAEANERGLSAGAGVAS